MKVLYLSIFYARKTEADEAGDAVFFVCRYSWYINGFY